MRVLVMSDMEGVSGIVKWDQVSTGKSLYEEGIEVLDGRRIRSRTSDWWTAWRQFYF